VLASTEKEIAAASITDATVHTVIAPLREAELRDALVTIRSADVVLQKRPIPSGDAGKDAKAAMETRRRNAENTAKAILEEAVSKARVFLAGGAEIGSNVTRADAVKEAAVRVLDRLFPEFFAGDHTGWEKVIDRARKKIPDALKEVGYSGEPQEHPVCKALLKALSPSAKGSELRNSLTGMPYGWPLPVAEAAALVLANAGQLKVTGPDGKAVVLADQNSQKFGTCTFTPETRVVTAKEKIAIRSLGGALGLTIPSGEESNYLISIVDRLAQAAEDSGGDAPAPVVPSPSGMTQFRAATGNDLLAALAARYDELKPLIEQWRNDKAEIAARLPKWRLAQNLVSLGADGQRATVDAVLTNRSLLTNPNPVPPLVTAAADDLRGRSNAAFAAWGVVWNAGEARLEADTAWNAITREKKHELRQTHGLLAQTAPDLSSPEKIADSIGKRSLSEWQNMTLALPPRVDAALRDAAIEIEPKTQSVSIPRRTLKTEAELDAWLKELREKIAPHLSDGPVLPSA
jgi:hypothetical protein